MTSRRLLILAALAIVVLVAALALTRTNSAGSTAGDKKLLYPELQSKLDTIDGVRVFKAGDAALIEAKRNGTEWVIANRDGYPADAAKVRKFLVATAEAKLVEEKTANAANYGAIGVQDVKEPAATGHRVEITSGAPPVNLIVGKQAPGSRAQYVRRVGDKQSWQINDSLDLPTTTDAWLRKEIIDVAPDRVQSATIAIGGKTYSAAKAARSDSEFKVEGLPKGKALSSPSAADGLGSALTALTLTDVRKSSQPQKAAAHATFRTFDGLVAEVDGWTENDKHYITLAASFDEALGQRFKAPAPEAKETTEASKGSSAPKPAAKPGVAAEAKTLNEKLADWSFEIPEYKYEAIFKPLDELLKKDEPLKK